MGQPGCSPWKLPPGHAAASEVTATLTGLDDVGLHSRLWRWIKSAELCKCDINLHQLKETSSFRLSFCLAPIREVHLLVSALAAGGAVPNMSLETGQKGMV